MPLKWRRNPSTEALQPVEAFLNISLVRPPAFDLVLKPEEHRAVLFLFVAVEIQIRERRGTLVHEEIEIEEGLHAQY
jgi:hypothetical protein